MAEPDKIFIPTEKDMRVEYPELAECDEFTTLTNNDIIFVWYYACKSSPYHTLGEKERMVVALRAAYGENFMIVGIAKKLSLGDVPDFIAVAINKMRSFNPSVRSRAKKITETIFDNFEKLLHIDDDTMQMMLMDNDQKKKYIELASKANQELPLIISNLERGYGVPKVKGTSFEGDEQSMMDTVINQASEN